LRARIRDDPLLESSAHDTVNLPLFASFNNGPCRPQRSPKWLFPKVLRHRVAGSAAGGSQVVLSMRFAHRWETTYGSLVAKARQPNTTNMNDCWPLILYVDLTMLAFGVAFMTVGMRAVRTKTIPIRGGGTRTGQFAVSAGWGYVFCGGIVALGGVIAIVAAFLIS
jgi:hypothetical protein